MLYFFTANVHIITPEKMQSEEEEGSKEEEVWISSEDWWLHFPDILW